MTQKGKVVPSQQDGEMHLDPVVSPGPHFLCTALLLMEPCLMARGIIFLRFILIGPLRFGFSGFAGGTGDKKAERRLEREGAH